MKGEYKNEYQSKNRIICKQTYAQNDQSKEKLDDTLMKRVNKSKNMKFRFMTKKETEKQEDDELCSKHGLPLRIISVTKHKMMWDKCIHESDEDLQPIFNATIAREIEDEFKDTRKSLVKNIQNFEKIDIKEHECKIQNQVDKFFGTFRSNIDKLEDQVVENIRNSEAARKFNETMHSVYDLLK